MTGINLLDSKSVKDNLREFKRCIPKTKDEGRKPWARYASFDYCFNYFQSFEDKVQLANSQNMETSCLHLAFYLASWGMLRGSTFLLQKSIRFYRDLITYISEKDADFWQIDVPNYEVNDNIAKLLQCGRDIKHQLRRMAAREKVSDILITKIMLGVFGSVPAFDTYFTMGSGLYRLNEKSLGEISKFYREDGRCELISHEATETKTFNFDTGKQSKRMYTKAKIIDMIFFIEGIQEEKRRQKVKS